MKLSPKFKVAIKLLQIAKVAEQLVTLVAEGTRPWGRGCEAIVCTVALMSYLVNMSSDVM